MGALLACGIGDNTTIDDQQLREDVLYCEDAVAYLETCCVGFVAQKLACVHYQKETQPSCGSGYSLEKEDPALDLAESKCISARSCDVLVRQGVCGRAQAARALRSATSYDEESGSARTPTTYATPRAKVCP
ncbi:MAG: hypothetical protein JWO86_4526 [Myxococcaceae bacterium]|jgi:hypothetical protein|nr:hypothetical protein [Myxococcaceae bacterium]